MGDDEPAPDAGARLDVEDLVVAFGDGEDATRAVDGVDLTVEPGEILAVLGPSGCGKTTLLRAVAGLTAPTAGRVRLDGSDLAGVPAHRRGIGLMFQDHALFPHRDVGGNVEFGLRMARVPGPERRRRVAEVLELVGLAGWQDRPVGPLSGGERQRVALARSLAPSPRLLLLDEPLGALDRTLRDRLVPELGSLFRRLGLTVVHVTHDQSEALALADRIAVMDAGRVAQVGTPAEVWSTPASPFVARFLGFTNVVPALVLARSGLLTGEPPAGVDAGSDQPVLVRGEGVALHVLEGEPPPGTVTGVVAEVVFRGDHSVVHVLLGPGLALDAVRPTAAGPVPEAGTTVAVTVDPASILAL